MGDRLLTVSETADRLGVSVRWVRRAVFERRIPFRKIGHLVRFRPDDLDDFIDAALVPAERE